jgi:hypothetical protein
MAPEQISVKYAQYSKYSLITEAGDRELQYPGILVYSGSAFGARDTPKLWIGTKSARDRVGR